MRWLCLPMVVVITLFLFPYHTALADAAPPEPPPGTSIEAGDPLTMVQMVSEEVLMTLRDDMTVEVVATFDMVNQGTAAESMDVRFPAGSTNWMSGELIALREFGAWVDGESAEVRFEQQGNPYGEGTVPWAVWPVTFPPSQTVKLAVGYQIDRQLFGKGGNGYGRFSYILETGAGWYGTIGEGTITFRTPYTINPTNVPMYEDRPQPQWYTVSENEIVWQFTDLEPTRLDNIEITVISPRSWRTIEAARNEVAQHPDSLDAQLYLAHSLKNTVEMNRGLWDYAGNVELANEMVVAYENALLLAPNSVELLVEYASVIWELAFLSHTHPEWNYRDKLIPALERALALDPDNEELLGIQWMIDEYPEHFGFVERAGSSSGSQGGSGRPDNESQATRTPRPTDVVTVIPTQAADSTEVAQVPPPTKTSTPPSILESFNTDEATAEGGFPIGVVIIPVIISAGLILWWFRSKK